MKNFIKSYLRDWRRFLFMLSILVPLSGLWYWLNVWLYGNGIYTLAFAAGYILFDPVSYYFTEYRRKLKALKMIEAILNEPSKRNSVVIDV